MASPSWRLPFDGDEEEEGALLSQEREEGNRDAVPFPDSDTKQTACQESERRNFGELQNATSRALETLKPDPPAATSRYQYWKFQVDPAVNWVAPDPAGGAVKSTCR